MAHVKRTPEAQESRHKQLEELRSRMASISRIGSMKNSAEWGDLKKILVSFADMEKRREESVVIDACDADEDPRKIKENLRVYRERRAAFELIIDLVDKSEEKQSHLSGAIKKLEDQYKEAAEELA